MAHRNNRDHAQSNPRRPSMGLNQPLPYRNSIIQPDVMMDPRRNHEVSAHHATEIVNINAGGRKYATLYETLARSKSTYFSHFIRVDDLSGKVVLHHHNFIADEDGSIFINRDGDLFAHVLQYMRDGKRTVLPNNIDLLKQLAREAEHFGMALYKDQLLDKLDIETKRQEEMESQLTSIKNTTNQISQSLYYNGFNKK